MCSDGISPTVELVTEQLSECIVGELRLLKADDVGLALVQPRQEPGNPLLDRVHIPGRYPHQSTVMTYA
jgi:hypothetical protein